MNEWGEVILQDVVEKFIDYRGKTPEKTTSGIPLVTAKIVKNGTILEPKEFVTKETYENFMTRGFPKENDVVLTTEAPLGEVALLKDDSVALAQRIILIRGKKETLDNSFLKYFLQSEEGQYRLDSRASGTTVFGIKASVLKEMPILMPLFEEQKAIAEVLSSLDDKIDLLHRQNKTLEAMAQTLFRQWFIEEADEGWEEVPLGDLCVKITKGTTPTTLKRQFVDSGINFIKVNCIDDDGNYLEDKFTFIDEETNELLGRSQLQEGDILYSIAGTIGRISVVSEDILPANTNQALAIIRADSSRINSNYIKYCLKDKDIVFELHSKIVHAVQPNLSLGEISNTVIPFPDEDTMRKFSLAFGPLEEKATHNKKQIKTLGNMRDTLLPKLMSGEVRVRYE